MDLAHKNGTIATTRKYERSTSKSANKPKVRDWRHRASGAGPSSGESEYEVSRSDSGLGKGLLEFLAGLIPLFSLSGCGSEETSIPRPRCLARPRKNWTAECYPKAVEEPAAARPGSARIMPTKPASPAPTRDISWKDNKYAGPSNDWPGISNGF
jgi:hypothetical protein